MTYAHVIFDLDRAQALGTVHGHLEDFETADCGRFRDWGYMWIDEYFFSGEKEGRLILDRQS